MTKDDSGYLLDALFGGVENEKSKKNSTKDLFRDVFIAGKCDSESMKEMQDRFGLFFSRFDELVESSTSSEWIDTKKEIPSKSGFCQCVVLGCSVPLWWSDKKKRFFDSSECLGNPVSSSIVSFWKYFDSPRKLYDNKLRDLISNVSHDFNGSFNPPIQLTIVSLLGVDDYSQLYCYEAVMEDGGTVTVESVSKLEGTMFLKWKPIKGMIDRWMVKKLD